MCSAGVQRGSHPPSDRQHAFVGIDGHDGPAPAHTSQRGTRDHACACTDIEHAITVFRIHHVKHRLDKLPEERRRKECLVYVGGRRRDLTRSGID